MKVSVLIREVSSFFGGGGDGWSLLILGEKCTVFVNLGSLQMCSYQRGVLI